MFAQNLTKKAKHNKYFARVGIAVDHSNIYMSYELWQTSSAYLGTGGVRDL